jgi:molybdopterin molybdotransferase
MLSVAEARKRLLEALPISAIDRVSLDSIFGRVLAKPVVARIPSPRFDNSSMDGFAVNAQNTEGASQITPITLKVVGDIPAGSRENGILEPGQAMRIMTGAPMPLGANAVVPVEDTDTSIGQIGAKMPANIKIMREVQSGAFVRPMGEDFKAGDTLIKAGNRVRPQDAALIASLGEKDIDVFRKPRIAILSSGDELLEPGEPLIPGKIYETNSLALAALVDSCGAEPILIGTARDDLDDVISHLDRAVEDNADMIISSAGVSVGAFDYLREAILKKGSLDFWKVNMRPGRPFAFGNYRGLPYVGLPGNPVSAFVGFEVFLRPAFNKMAGVANWSRLVLRAELLSNASSDGRETFLRGKMENRDVHLFVRLTGHQGSGNLYSLVQANALVHLPSGVTEVSAGSQVEIWPLGMEAGLA